MSRLWTWLPTDAEITIWLREKAWYPINRQLHRARRVALVLKPDNRIPKAELEEIYPDGTKCVHCGGWHLHACPRVKAMKFLGENPQEIEFWPWGAWPANQVVFPWQKAAMIKPEEELK